MFDINKINNEEESQFLVGFDYDGVITKRGSSGENEEKWQEREKHFMWRKVLNLVSKVYNSFFPLNEGIIELTQLLRELGCKIVVISSHTLTTSNYKESEQTRTRVKNRLIKKDIAFDDIIFIKGDKVEVCQKLGVDLMSEDNVDKIKALRKGGIPTVSKKTDKNRHLLEHDPDAIEEVADMLPFVVEAMNNKELLSASRKALLNYNNSSVKSYEKSAEHKPGALYETFSSSSEEELVPAEVLFTSDSTIQIIPPISMKKLLLPQKKYKK